MPELASNGERDGCGPWVLAFLLAMLAAYAFIEYDKAVQKAEIQKRIDELEARK